MLTKPHRCQSFPKVLFSSDVATSVSEWKCFHSLTARGYSQTKPKLASGYLTHRESKKRHPCT